MPPQIKATYESYSLRDGIGRWGSGDIGLILAFSGGGTRAAALAYGVLEELRDTRIIIDGRKYAHFVDGGIIDNLGLRAVYEIIEVAGGARAFLKRHDRKPPRRLAIVSVNASTDPEPKMDLSTKQPSLDETINAVSDVQLHRYNAATLELMNQSVTRWARAMSTPSRPVTPYFIQLSFRDIDHATTRNFFNRIPTSFSLTDEQVDKLIAAGRELLRSNPDSQRFVAGLNGRRTTRR